MNISGRTLAVILGVIVVVGVALFLAWGNQGSGPIEMSTSTVSTSTNNGATSTPITATSTLVSSVKLALLDLQGTTNGKARGCDKMVMISYRIASTTQPLTAAMQKLFSLGTTTVGSWYNFIQRTSTTLHFDHATVANGTANIYLTGSLSGLAGVCDDPRAAAQIEETALQFPTVQRVQLYLNNATTTLVPSER